MDKKETLILHRGQIESLLNLSSLKDIKAVLRAIVSYGLDEVEPDIPEHLAFGWLWFKHTIDHHREQYQATVEARRNAGKASAEKRLQNKQMSTNPTNVNFVEQSQQPQQMSTNPTEYEYDYDNNYILSSGASACAYGDDAEAIAGIFPEAKVGDYRKLVTDIIAAIQKEIDRGVDTDKAVEIVRTGTQLYANAMADKPKKFLAKPEDFFGKGQYNFDPEVWLHPEQSSANANGSRSKDVLHNNPQFAANERGLVQDD